MLSMSYDHAPVEITGIARYEASNRRESLEGVTKLRRLGDFAIIMAGYQVSMNIDSLTNDIVLLDNGWLSKPLPHVLFDSSKDSLHGSPNQGWQMARHSLVGYFVTQRSDSSVKKGRRSHFPKHVSLA